MRHDLFCRLVPAVALAFTLAAGVAGADKEPLDWQPHKTRAFIVCLAKFKGEKTPSFSTDDRLDGRLVEELKKRGVPESQIVFLKDEHATTKNIQKEFTEFLRKSSPGETLLFYYGSHGGYNPKTGEHWFVSFDSWLAFPWVFDAIEHDFKGAHAILLADCCYSGGLVEMGKSRKNSMACLSSTYAHQTAHSGWRFIQCVLRALEGNPVLDRDGDGHIDLKELADYTEHYMAFCAEGKPMFGTTSGFNPRLRLAAVKGKKKDAGIGKLIEVQSNKKWYPAEILDEKDRELRIHFTADTKPVNDRWVPASATRAPVYPQFKVGSKVEVQRSGGEEWHPATVVENWESLHLCRCDGLTAAYDEWFGPSRIRPRK